MKYLKICVGAEVIEFSFFNYNVKIDFLFVAVLTFIIVTDKTYLSLCAITLIFIHELGHIISAKLLKVPICEISFGLASVDIAKPPLYYQKSFTQKMIIVLSGFIFNFLVYIILFCIYVFTQNEFVMLIAFQSLVIGVINILPIESLDGGEAAKLVLHRFLNHESARKISNMLSWLFLAPIIVLGIVLIIKSWRNISFIMFVLYLIFEKYFI